MKLLACAAAAVVAMWAGSAGAATVIATYTGTVVSGTDGSDFFGGGDLTGDAFSATATFDDPAYVLGSGEVLSQTVGNSGYLTGISLTVGSNTYSPQPLQYASALENAFSPRPRVNLASSTFINSSYGNDFISFMISAPATQAVNTPIFEITSTDAGTGGFSVADTNAAVSINDLILNTFVDPTEPTGVPEPKTWALMLAGFGLLGSALRTRPRLAY